MIGCPFKKSLSLRYMYILVNAGSIHFRPLIVET